MDNDEISYSLEIKLSGFPRYLNETDEIFQERVREEGKKRLRYFLSGYLVDTDNKIIFEQINFDKLNNK